MKEDNLIEHLKNIENGICIKCGSQKGHFGDDTKIFCYKCSGYKIVSQEESKILVKRRKLRLREEFKRIAIKSDIFYCLKLFLSIGETIISENNNPIRNSNTDSQNIIIIDPRRIVIANLGVKWLLEDSIDHKPDTIPWNASYCTNMMNLLRTWLDWNRKEKLADGRYKLGFFVAKNSANSFYFTQLFDFYMDSLRKFGITSPDDINIDEFSNMLEKLKKLERNRENFKSYIRNEYPVLLSTMVNSYYTEEVIRPFSFDYLMDENNSKLEEVLSHPKLRMKIDDLKKEKHKFTRLFLALLEKLYEFYYKLSPKSINDSQKDGLVIVRNITQLNQDLSQEKLLIPLFKDYLISSTKNFHQYPFIIEFGGNFIITPIRLWIGYRLLHYALNKDKINSDLARKYEDESMQVIENKLKEHGVEIFGKEIKTSKKGNEIDLFGCYQDFILIIECKGFHPSPFFMMRKSRRFNDQFLEKMKIVDKLKNWIVSSLTNLKSRYEYIELTVYDNKNKEQIKLKIPQKYCEIDRDKILYLYITQIKEFHPQTRDDVIQCWSGDL